MPVVRPSPALLLRVTNRNRVRTICTKKKSLCVWFCSGTWLQCWSELRHWDGVFPAGDSALPPTLPGRQLCCHGCLCCGSSSPARTELSPLFVKHVGFALWEASLNPSARKKNEGLPCESDYCRTFFKLEIACSGCVWVSWWEAGRGKAGPSVCPGGWSVVVRKDTVMGWHLPDRKYNLNCSGSMSYHILFSYLHVPVTSDVHSFFSLNSLPWINHFSLLPFFSSCIVQH